MKVHIREMTVADLGRVALIEASSFSAPWTLGMFRDELFLNLSWHRIAVEEKEDHDEVAGYLVGRLYIDIWHLMNLAVAEVYRRNGIGTALLEEFLSAAAREGKDVLLEVRPSNVTALTLYRNHGFELVGVRRRYYSDNQEDAYVLQWDFEKSRVRAR